MEPEDLPPSHLRARHLMRERSRTPTQLVDRAWEQIKQHRETLKSSGVKVGTKWFHSDPGSRIQQLGLVLMGANVPAVQWKTMDGTFVTMTPTLAGQIFQATAASDMAVFVAAELHLANLKASADPSNYDWLSGWPATYSGA